jgi:hypothetical protein
MTRTSLKPVAIAGLAAAAIVAGAAVVSGMRAPVHPGGAIEPPAATAFAPVWTETKWPHLMDQWGVGRSFVCAAADCGARIELQIRPKIGFCNCSTGIADDTELERVADTDLISPKVKPLGPSRPVKVGWMYGLSRPYAAAGGEEGERLLSIAFNDECDAVVALARLGHADPAAVEPAVVAFLNTRPMVLWTKTELGLEYIAREW